MLGTKVLDAVGGGATSILGQQGVDVELWRGQADDEGLDLVQGPSLFDVKEHLQPVQNGGGQVGLGKVLDGLGRGHGVDQGKASQVGLEGKELIERLMNAIECLLTFKSVTMDSGTDCCHMAKKSSKSKRLPVWRRYSPKNLAILSLWTLNSSPVASMNWSKTWSITSAGSMT